MNPLSGIYGSAVRTKNAAYDAGLLRSLRLAWPVISVGNLSAGGSGKTPFVIALAKLLMEQGLFVTVLSRGYRRKSRSVEVVDPSGSASRYGDEPLLIARKLGIPVVVGASRFQCGVLAERTFAANGRQGVHILDDGFQHRRLARNFDFVLLPPEDLSGTLQPGGRLREGIASLDRADAVVITGENSIDGLPALAQGKVCVIRRKLCLPHEMPSRRVLAFCGIARPERFFSDLRRLEVGVAANMSFRDHHRYSRADIDRLIARRKAVGADSFVTTEKDWINLGQFLPMLSPITAVELTLQLLEPQSVIQMLMARKSAGTPPRMPGMELDEMQLVRFGVREYSLLFESLKFPGEVCGAF